MDSLIFLDHNEVKLGLTFFILDTGKQVLSQTVKTQMKWCWMWHFISIYNVCEEKNNLQEQKYTNLQDGNREHSGSMVVCLTRDRGAAGSSLTGVTALCPWARHINRSLVLVQPRKTCHYITERLLLGRKESNQTKKKQDRNPLKDKVDYLQVLMLSQKCALLSLVQLKSNFTVYDFS